MVLILCYAHAARERTAYIRTVYMCTRKCMWRVYTQSTQSAGPVRFLIFCSISIFVLASPVAGRGPQYTAGAD